MVADGRGEEVAEMWVSSYVKPLHQVKEGEREEKREQTPRDKLVTSVYPCIEQLLHKLTIKKPHLGSHHCR